MNNKFFKIVADWDLKISEIMLFDVYLPIIKMETLAFYQNLKILINNNKGICNLSTFLKKNKMTETDFFDYLHKLEGVKLVDTYQDIYEDKINYFIKFNDTLSFKEILKNKDFYKLLESSMSETEFDALNQKIHVNDNLKKMTNESWTIQDAYLSSKVKPVGFQIDELKSILEKKQGYKINFSTEVIEYLQNRFHSNPYNYDEIANILTSTIVDLKSNPHISYSLMLAEFEENNDLLIKNEVNTTISKPKNNPPKFVKLIRTEEIYSPETDINDFLDVLNDFQKYDALTYISSIHCKKIPDEFLILINDLQERYKFSDELINVLFDYCNWKTNGYFNQKYIQKIAATIFSLNIEQIKDLIAHLKNPKFKKTKTISKKEKSLKSSSITNAFECETKKQNNEHEDNGF